MTWLALILSVILVILAAIHLLWALGYWWPVRDEAQLARTVVGTEGIAKMPNAAQCSFVVVALLFAAAWPWLMAEDTAPLGTLGGWVLTAVFLGRGIAGYIPAWRRLTPEQPFASLDQTLYSPLCLALGLGFAIFIWSIL